ncbi:Lysosomal-associated transmembrane protein [Aphelenchoides bicaudatus]|nr:Lysosomal-associated transmembrane protein [Aphelenchoides bicaudatus]
MRAMNGRLQSVLRSPLMRNNHLNNLNNVNAKHHRRRSSEMLPKMVQFDEGSEDYRCFCSCFHIKTGTLFIAGFELFFILFYFLNALLVRLQQKHAYDPSDKSGDYAQIAFIVTAACCGIATFIVLSMIAGVMRNLLVIGIIGVLTNSALCYRILNAAPFNEYPGQSTVALPFEISVRIYLVLFIHLVVMILEIYFTIVVYHCNTYFSERKSYMKYCIAYSRPMETLNSAR